MLNSHYKDFNNASEYNNVYEDINKKMYICSKMFKLIRKQINTDINKTLQNSLNTNLAEMHSPYEITETVVYLYCR